MDKQTMIHTGPWHILTRIIGVDCPDGRQRTVRIQGHPDTAFTIRGKVSCQGMTVSGYVWMSSEGRYRFTPTGKNAIVMGEWKHEEV